MSKWPRDNQAELLAFYGTPGAAVERQMVDVVPPFRMTYAGRPVRVIKFHAKAAPALRSALVKIWNYYGRDQAVIDRLGISHYDGAYNPRRVRGSETKWSNHAFAAAIDLDAAHNGFNTGHGTMPLPVVAAFKSEGFRWGGDYSRRSDPMHFEACDSGEPARTFEQWLAFYKCPPRYRVEAAPVRIVDEPEPVPPSKKPSLFRRIRNHVVGWVSGGASFAGLGALTDWQIAVVVFVAGFAFLGSGFLVWLWLVDWDKAALRASFRGLLGLDE